MGSLLEGYSRCERMMIGPLTCEACGPHLVAAEGDLGQFFVLGEFWGLVHSILLDWYRLHRVTYLPLAKLVYGY